MNIINMDNSNKNRADNAQGENLQLQQQWRQKSSNDHKAPEERPYRRRIKPPPAKVHHVHPARFRRFVQRRTCCLLALPQHDAPPWGSSSGDATASTASSTTAELLQPPPADAAVGDGYSATDAAGCLDVTGKSMQEAYMAWCSSNDIPLSPGTMAELSFTEHLSNHQR